MKQRKIVIILSAVLALSLILSVTTFAMFPMSDVSSAVPIEVKEIYKRADALKTKTVILPSKEQRVVTYKQTEQITRNTYTDIYASENEEYWINQEGKLTAYIANDSFLKTKNAAITEEQAKKIADAHIAEFYGELNGYVFDFCKYYEAKEAYNVRYSLKVGDTDFIYADICSVTVNKDGKIMYSRAPVDGIINSFDHSLVKGVTEKSIEIYVAKHIYSIYDESEVDSYRVENNTWLRKNDAGKYHLALSVVVRKTDGTTMMQEYIYELE